MANTTVESSTKEATTQSSEKQTKMSSDGEDFDYEDDTGFDEDVDMDGECATLELNRGLGHRFPFLRMLMTHPAASDTSEQGDAFDDDEGYDAFDVTAGGKLGGIS